MSEAVDALKEIADLTGLPEFAVAEAQDIARAAIPAAERENAGLIERVGLLADVLREEHPMWADRSPVLGHDPRTCRACRTLDGFGEERKVTRPTIVRFDVHGSTMLDLEHRATLILLDLLVGSLPTRTDYDLEVEPAVEAAQVDHVPLWVGHVRAEVEHGPKDPPETGP
jgi:hypothetical protein